MDAATRKTYPLYSGLLKYFPDALMEVAHLSKVGNDQHNPGQPLHWNRAKSQDQLDALMRHLKDAGTRDTDGERHSAKVALRALAELQLELERDRMYESVAQMSFEEVAAQEAQVSPPPYPPSVTSDFESAKDFLKRLAETHPAPPTPAPPTPAPFIPMTFSRPPNTQDFGPDYESDGEGVSDAVGGEEPELVSTMETYGDMIHDTPPPQIGDPHLFKEQQSGVPIRLTSQDKPVWKTQSIH